MKVERRKKYYLPNPLLTSLRYSVLRVSPMGRILCLLHASCFQQSASGVVALASAHFLGVAESQSSYVFSSITNDLTVNSLLTEYLLSLVTCLHQFSHWIVMTFYNSHPSTSSMGGKPEGKY